MNTKKRRVRAGKLEGFHLKQETPKLQTMQQNKKWIKKQKVGENYNYIATGPSCVGFEKEDAEEDGNGMDGWIYKYA